MQETQSQQKYAQINLTRSSELSQKWWRWRIQFRRRLLFFRRGNLATKSKRHSKSNRRSKSRAIRKPHKIRRARLTLSNRRSKTNPNNKWRSLINKLKFGFPIQKKAIRKKFKKEWKRLISYKIEAKQSILIKSILQQTNKHRTSRMTIRVIPDSILWVNFIWSNP